MSSTGVSDISFKAELMRNEATQRATFTGFSTPAEVIRHSQCRFAQPFPFSTQSSSDQKPPRAPAIWISITAFPKRLYFGGAEPLQQDLRGVISRLRL